MVVGVIEPSSPEEEDEPVGGFAGGLGGDSSSRCNSLTVVERGDA